MKNNNNAPLNPLTLLFRDNATKNAFHKDFFRKTITQLRLNILLGAFLYGILGVIDHLVVPDIQLKAWFIRYCIVCPVVIGIYLLTFTRFFRKLMHPMLVFGGFVASAGAIALILIAPAPVSYLYFTGLLLCLIFYYTFVGMRFYTASMLSWGSFLLYLALVRWKSDIPTPYLIHNTLVLLAFNITGMWGSYLRERYMLSDFMHRRTILNQKAVLRMTMQDIEKARCEAEEISRLDPLTNLFNRRHFFSVANIEFERDEQYPVRLALIMIDIDHFKSINDTHGHHAGDLVLLSVTESIRSTVRRSDIPCRYGGEEFLILLPDTELSAAVNIGKRLREIIESKAIDTGKDNITVTASVGVAAMSENDDSKIDVLIRRADQALYEAKLGGRNQVKVWNREPSHNNIYS
jgi:diguanylate cyclase